MAGKHRARKREAEAHVWLGTGAVTLGLGVALATGSGVAQAETTNVAVAGSGAAPSSGKSAATTSIRTTISAHSVNTSTHAPAPVAGSEKATSVVTTKESVVRQMSPAVTGDNDAESDPGLAADLFGLGGAGTGIPVGEVGPSIPFVELGGGGGGLLSRIAGALGF